MMDWLCDNINGTIPVKTDLTPHAQKTDDIIVKTIFKLFHKTKKVFIVLQRYIVNTRG